MPTNLDWWFNSDAGLASRIGMGATVLAILAAWDVFRYGRRATRWREYLFLVVAAGAAMIYGVVNDRVASSISWEYFYFGKGLDQQLGATVPPEMGALHWEACKMGLKATWSAGLIIGVVMLIANNPRRNRKQLPYRSLMALLLVVLFVAALFALIGGWVGSRRGLAGTSRDLQLIVRDDLFRPNRFMCVYGMNLGGYLGGILASLGCAIYISRTRPKQASRSEGQTGQHAAGCFAVRAGGPPNSEK